MSDDQNLHMTGPGTAAVADEAPFVPPMDTMDDAWMDRAEQLDAQAFQTPHAIPQPQRPKGVMDLPFLRVFKRPQRPADESMDMGFVHQPVSPQPMPVHAEPGKTKSKGMRVVTVASLCGIALLGYLQYGPGTQKVLDMLGSRLPATGLPNPMPDLQERIIDPRFADGEPLPASLEPFAVGGLEAETAEPLPEAVAPVETEPTAAASSIEDGAVEPLIVPAAAAPSSIEAIAQPAAAAMASAPAPARIQPTATTAADADVLARMQRLETMLATMTQQLADLKSAQAHPAANPAAAAQQTAKPIQSAPRAVEAEHRPAPKRLLVKAESARAVAPRPARPKPAAAPVVAEKPKSGLGGQLVSVDMWNGEPSVVVTSGIPGDRRVRVLRPGDVVNGLALKSADPVARTATFVAPGSQGLTLSVNSGG